MISFGVFICMFLNASEAERIFRAGTNFCLRLALEPSAEGSVPTSCLRLMVPHRPCVSGHVGPLLESLGNFPLLHGFFISVNNFVHVR